MSLLMQCTLILTVIGGFIGADQSGAGGAVVGSLATLCATFLLIMWYGGK